MIVTWVVETSPSEHCNTGIWSSKTHGVILDNIMQNSDVKQDLSEDAQQLDSVSVCNVKWMTWII